MKRTALLLGLYLLWSYCATAQSTNELHGTITDTRSGLALPGATVFISDLNRAVVSDSLGVFQLKGIPPGKYLVEVSLVGYATLLDDISLKGIVKRTYALSPATRRLKEVVVTGVIAATDQQHSPISFSIVNQNDLLESSCTNVIDAIAKQPGVSAITDGPSISKPVIRGLGYNRVLTINDGVEQVDQTWFDEFGIEADPDAVNRFEILKGPGSLAYGSDAIAGVVSLIPEPDLPESQLKGDILFNVQSNNGLLNTMAHVAGTSNGLSWSARIDNTMAHAYQDPYDGYALNTQFSNFNCDGTVGLHRKWGYTQIHASYFDMATGIVDGTRDSATGQLERQVAYPGLNGGQPTYVLPTHQEQVSYTPFCINQRIRHTKLVWENSVAVGSGRITGLFSWQKNQRQEINDPTMANTADIYYYSNAATYDLRYISPQMGGFNLSAGANGVYQASQSLGTLMLIPNYDYFQIGAFAIVNQQLGKLNLSGGIRYDSRIFHGVDHWVDSATQTPVAPNTPGSFHEFTGFTSRFSGPSFSVGGAYGWGKNGYLKANLAAGWRAPNVAECAANGVHDGTVVYEIGDPNLNPETNLEEDLAVGINSKDVTAEIDVFNNSIRNFIYAEGLKSVFGGDSINNSFNQAGLGEAPVYKYTQGQARLYGGELSLNIHPNSLRWLEWNSTLSVVFGGLLHVPDSVKYLPFVPPTRITSAIKFHVLPSGRAVKNAYVQLGLLACAEQKDIYLQYAIYNGLNTAVTPFEYAASREATQGYILFNAGLGGDLQSRGHTVCQVFVLASNVFNTPYMDYMSRFKYYPVNYTTGRVGVFNMGRNISVKILIPIDLSHQSNQK